MIVWMRRHARGLKGALQENARAALASGSAGALVAMAFLAVLREGFETSVFLLAVFQDATDTTAAGAGAVLGLVAALVIGYALYRGGLRINLQRFFRFTGVVLALVAAGLLADRRPHRARGGLAQLLQAQPARPQRARRARHRPRRAADRHARPAAVSRPPARSSPTCSSPSRWSCSSLWPAGRPKRPARGRDRARRRHRDAACSVAPAPRRAAARAATGGGGSRRRQAVAVTLTTTAAAPVDLETAAGPTTFNVTGGGAGKVTEFEVFDGCRILGEVENVTPGLKRSFALTLKPGNYVLSCTGGSQEPTGKLTVTARRRRRGQGQRRRGGRRQGLPRLPRASRPPQLVTDDQEVHRRRHRRRRRQGQGGLRPGARALRAHRARRRVASAASTRRSTPARATCRRASGPASTCIEKALWVDGTTDGHGAGRDASCRPTSRSSRKLVKTVEHRAGAGRQRRRRRCSARSPSPRSRARRSATRTSTSSTSRPTSQGARAAYEIVAPILRDEASRSWPTRSPAQFTRGRQRSSPTARATGS